MDPLEEFFSNAVTLAALFSELILLIISSQITPEHLLLIKQKHVSLLESEPIQITRLAYNYILSGVITIIDNYN